jgi:hypothetical protein
VTLRPKHRARAGTTSTGPATSAIGEILEVRGIVIGRARLGSDARQLCIPLLMRDRGRGFTACARIESWPTRAFTCGSMRLMPRAPSLGG